MMFGAARERALFNALQNIMRAVIVLDNGMKKCSLCGGTWHSEKERSYHFARCPVLTARRAMKGMH